MKISGLHLKNYRNIKETSLFFDPDVNILRGDNAQGKTNVLEALYYAGVLRSFRMVKDGSLLKDGEDFFEISVTFDSDDTENELMIKFDKRRHVFLNGVKIKKSADAVSKVKAVLFAPEHLGLIKDGPSVRRQFLDFALFEIKPRYEAAVETYEKIVRQKNALLKNERILSDDVLDVYNERIANLGAYIIKMREKYLEELSKLALEVHLSLSSGKEKLSLEYLPSLRGSEDDIFKELCFKKNVEKQAATSLYGPHRDMIDITINGKSAKEFGSQGQQRSAVLSIKLSESELLKRATGQMPILLLDDVLSELDEKRREFIIKEIKDRQVFITCCEQIPFLQSRSSLFFVKNGVIEGQGGQE